MKLIQVLVYDVETETVLSVGDLELPSTEIDEHQISPLDAACNVLNSLGLDACMFAAVHKNEECEIWQALEVVDILEFEGEVPTMQWLAPEFVDCKTNGKWQKKFIRKNLPQIVAERVKEV